MPADNRYFSPRRLVTYRFCLVLAIVAILYVWHEELPPFRKATSPVKYPSVTSIAHFKLLEQQNIRTPKYTFMVAGIQKSGTTALCAYLRKHPYLQVTMRKELHFFDNEKINWKAPDYRAYESYNLSGTPSTAVGECTPIYIYWPNAMERIQRYNPKLKIILIFRHPVERAFSHWDMQRKKGFESKPFSWAIRKGRRRLSGNSYHAIRNHKFFSYVERSFYGKQLERLLRLFPREQLLFLLYSDFVGNPTKTIQEISHFLGVSAPEKKYKPFEKESSGQSNRTGMNAQDAEYLQSLYNDDLKLFAKLSGLNITSWFR